MGGVPPYRTVRTAAAWIDLLGYSDALRDARHDLTANGAQQALHRALRFQQSFNRRETFARIVVIEDGALVFSDLEDAGDYVASKICTDDWTFVEHALDLHSKANDVDDTTVGEQAPGARMVVCCGRRIVRSVHVPHLQERNIEFAMRNIEKSAPPANALQKKLDRMIAEANEPTVSAPAHMQFNTAVSMAYLADQLGSRVGLAGRFAYIDGDLLTNKPPASEWSFERAGVVDGSGSLPVVEVLGRRIHFSRAVREAGSGSAP